MEQITTDQINTLANQFLEMGKALLAYRENNQGISPGDDAILDKLQTELLDKAGQLATMAAIAAGQAAANAVKDLVQLNDQITQSLQNLADVQNAINIATAAVKVIVSVISMNPGNIVDAVSGLTTTCNIKLP